MRVDDGGSLSGSEEENEAKRLELHFHHSLNLQEELTPMITIVLMGIPSAQPPETDRFGDGNVTDTEENEQGVANDS